VLKPDGGDWTIDATATATRRRQIRSDRKP
jgi:hypothetical protein